MRFNKEIEGTGISFPITQKMIDNLPVGTKVHSPIAVTHPWVKIQPKDIPYTPKFPGDIGFQEELNDVVEYVKEAKIKKFSKFKVSNTIKSFGVYNPEELAQLVRADMPPDIVIELVNFLLKDGCKFRNITNEGNYGNFTNGVVLLCRILAWSIHYVSPSAFASKWYYGVPRPEEVVGAWARNEYNIDIDIDRTWKAKIADDPRTFTRYMEGCPLHPSLCAMHSAAAAATLIIPVFLDVSPEHFYEIRDTMLGISMGRTFAGVHYKQDNYYGLELGERVIQNILPAKLEKFGADKHEVIELLKKYKTNWLDFIS